MPPTHDFDDSEGDPSPKPSLWMRFQTAIVKPDDLDSPKRKAEEPEESIEELQAIIARADDKERNIGLIAAPIGAIVGLLITGNLINHAKSLGQSTSVYQTLTFVLLGLAALMLAMAWFRKRLLLGIVLAMFGLGIFNLHFWGFGVPFILAGAWLLVRSYRLQKKLKLAGGGSNSTYGPPTTNRIPSAGGVLARPNKRYTPPTEKIKRPSKPKPRG
jgi:hypothetical protein